MSTAFIDSVQKQTAGHSISTLNESLVSAVPELSTGALVAPYAWVSHEAWAVVAALTFVLRTIAAYMQQNPTRVLDQIGQKVSSTLSPPRILVRFLPLHGFAAEPGSHAEL